MVIFRKKKEDPAVIATDKNSQQTTPAETPAAQTPVAQTPDSSSIASQPVAAADNREHTTWLALVLGSVAAIGGFIFGYESGQISGKSLSCGFPTLLTSCRFPCHVRLPRTFWREWRVLCRPPGNDCRLALHWNTSGMSRKWLDLRPDWKALYYLRLGFLLNHWSCY